MAPFGDAAALAQRRRPPGPGRRNISRSIRSSRSAVHSAYRDRVVSRRTARAPGTGRGRPRPPRRRPDSSLPVLAGQGLAEHPGVSLGDRAGVAGFEGEGPGHGRRWYARSEPRRGPVPGLFRAPGPPRRRPMRGENRRAPPRVRAEPTFPRSSTPMPSLRPLLPLALTACVAAGARAAPPIRSKLSEEETSEILTGLNAQMNEERRRRPRRRQPRWRAPSSACPTSPRS